MAGSTVPNQLALDSVLLHRKEDTTKFCMGKNVTGVGRSIVGMLSYE